MKLTPNITRIFARSKPKGTIATALDQASGEIYLHNRGFSDIPGPFGKRQWRLPHSLYRPTKLELMVIYHLSEHHGYGGLSLEAKRELEFTNAIPWTCKIGFHVWGIPLPAVGPNAAIEMHERSGAFVVTYSGEWKTCKNCRRDHNTTPFPEN